MKYEKPTELQIMCYLVGNLPQGTIFTLDEIEENLDLNKYNSEKIKEALTLMSSGTNGIPRFLLKEGEVYTILSKPGEVIYHIPSEEEDNLENVLEKFKPKKEI